ncbi:hypothetical protein M422DRAFT_275217 [Sphaerobolus stellatus SS14]|uniref:FYVE-type domain-containing protein n=1 Tax=Sphaerobolus stellatus (strain SS14) TaxID=990650 RepID=A0A0C9U4N8_SPHS4|nr:hypothetical protein M422DRAFT_275217 [Sphaerobolus stellatus SS14]
MSNNGHGLPLLSGPPPDPTPGVDPTNCMRCDKEFFPLFSRPKRCNHCGYSYCSSCTDYQALMPRSGPNGTQAGYEPMPVCTNCAEKLTVTASGRSALKEYSVQRLKAYMKAYNIQLPGAAVEKEELVQAIMRARVR